jgi:hypothetical protein
MHVRARPPTASNSTLLGSGTDETNGWDVNTPLLPSI